MSPQDRPVIHAVIICALTLAAGLIAASIYAIVGLA